MTPLLPANLTRGWSCMAYGLAGDKNNNYITISLVPRVLSKRNYVLLHSSH